MTLLHWLLLFAQFMGRSRWQQILTRAVNCQNFGKWNPDKRFGAKSRLKHSGEKPHCSMPIEQWGKANCTGGKSRLKYKKGGKSNCSMHNGCDAPWEELDRTHDKMHRGKNGGRFCWHFRDLILTIIIIKLTHYMGVRLCVHIRWGKNWIGLCD